MINQVFIPTVAELPRDVERSVSLQQPLIDYGYSPGLMVVIRRGKEGVYNRGIVDQQYQNLKSCRAKLGTRPVVIELSNLPIEETDFLHHPYQAVQHVQHGVDFARNLPFGGRRIVTFHLNTLVPKAEFQEVGEEEWKNRFHQHIRPKLIEVAQYARGQGVNTLVETVPVPEFGDIPSTDHRRYQRVPLADLRNPFYLTGMWGFEQLRDAGLGICLDVCHTRTIYEALRRNDPEELLFPMEHERARTRTLADDVRDLQPTDLVHLNDGDGRYSRQGSTVFREGVALGKGDIRELPELIRDMNTRKIPFVLEINETDYEKRPETQASIEYLARL
jgi:hypothetical protein